MHHFDSWYKIVTQGIIKSIQNESAERYKDQPALQRKLYKQIHLHGLGDLDPVLELSNSLLRDIPHIPTTFVESDWIVSEILGDDLLLKRRGIVIKAPRDHKFLTFDLKSKTATIKKPRYAPAIMPDWDRIISAFGWPSFGDARIYLPTVTNPVTVERIIRNLDSTNLRWHMKTTRRENTSRPDSVVLYVDKSDINDTVTHIQSVIPTTKARIPGFSLPLNEAWTIGLGTVRPEARQVSYGWSFAAEIAKALQDLAHQPTTAEDKAKLSLQKLIDSSQKGKTDVQLPW